MGVYPRTSKSLYDYKLKLQGGIDWDLERHVEAHTTKREIMGRYGLVWSQFTSKIENFNIHTAKKKYEENNLVSGRA